MARVYETALVLFLLSLLVCGLAWVASAIIDGDRASRQALFGIEVLACYNVKTYLGVQHFTI